MTRVLLAFLLLAAAPPLAAEELSKETVQAWDRYIGWAGAKVQRELSDPEKFPIQNNLPSSERAAVLRTIESGGIYASRMTGVVPPGNRLEIPGGEIHHWWGAILLRGVSLPNLLKFLQDYNNHAGKFADVERSRILSHDGNHYRVFFRFSRSKAFVTAVYNTEQDCLYTYHGQERASSRSVATKIAEVENPGTASEREKSPGDDRGFLWRLVSWWRYEQKGNDVIVELESASLSRDIPGFVKLLPGVSNYIRSTPKESLESVLNSIRAHVKDNSTLR